jgi:hypothetical protein
LLGSVHFRALELQLSPGAKGNHMTPNRPSKNLEQCGIDAQELRKYSLARAFHQLLNGDPRAASFEREVSDALSGGGSSRGLTIPWSVLQRAIVQKGSTGTGDELIAMDKQEFHDHPFADLVCARAGATLMQATGDVSIPVGDGAFPTPSWVDETDPAPQVTPAYASRTLTPHTCAAYVQASRRMCVQVTDIADLLRRNLMRALLTEADRVCFQGSGQNGEPLGIAGTQGVGALQNFDATDFASWIGAWGTLKGNLGQTDSTTAFAASYRVAATAMSSPVDAGSGRMIGTMIAPDDIRVAGGTRLWPTHVIALEGSPAVEEPIFYGRFADLVIATFGGGVDVKVDKGTQLDGSARIIGFLDMDLAVVLPSNFAYGTYTPSE